MEQPCSPLSLSSVDLFEECDVSADIQLFAGPGKLETLYECFLTIMSNISPDIKTVRRLIAG
jgi:hypothetical protein